MAYVAYNVFVQEGDYVYIYSAMPDECWFSSRQRAMPKRDRQFFTERGYDEYPSRDGKGSTWVKRQER